MQLFGLILQVMILIGEEMEANRTMRFLVFGGIVVCIGILVLMQRLH